MRESVEPAATVKKKKTGGKEGGWETAGGKKNHFSVIHATRQPGVESMRTAIVLQWQFVRVQNVGGGKADGKSARTKSQQNELTLASVGSTAAISVDVANRPIIFGPLCSSKYADRQV